jgi:pimeloyl-ACP methyl ester carboxylesterase
MKADKNIILLHGWGSSTVKLRSLAFELRSLGWRVKVPKLPGFEAKAPNVGWTLDDYVNHLQKEITAANFSNYFVFGHSFGGRVAIKFAFKGANIQGVVLCAAGGISRGNLLKRMVFTIFAKMGKVFVINSYAAKLFRKVLYKAAREHDYENTKGSMRQTFKNVVSEDLKRIIPKIKTPVLVLWGENDKMTPVADAHFLNKNIRKSKLIIYENEGHRLPYAKAKDLAKEINLWYQTL